MNNFSILQNKNTLKSHLFIITKKLVVLKRNSSYKTANLVSPFGNTRTNMYIAVIILILFFAILIQSTQVSKFLVFTFSRSGGSMLMDELNNHPEICMSNRITHGEYLNWWHEANLQYIKDVKNPAQFESYIKELFEDRPNNNTVRGTKYSTGYVSKYSKVGVSEEDLFNLFKRLDVHFVYLIRSNYLQQYVSETIARQRGTWYCAQDDIDKCKKNITLDIDTNEMADFLLQREKDHKDNLEKLRKYNLQHEVVHYEDCIDPEIRWIRCFNKITRLLQINPVFTPSTFLAKNEYNVTINDYDDVISKIKEINI